MWQPERTFVGPRRAHADDVGALNRLFSESFTERYRRDGMSGVRVPPLNPRIWEYAIRDAADGAMVWDDEHGAMVAFNIAHRSGTEGWMGPLAVRTDRQGAGLGRMIVTAAIDWLRATGVRTLGLETMPRTIENIGFYGRLGFVPGHLTVTMTGSTAPRGARDDAVVLSTLSPEERTAWMARCRARLDRSVPGVDYTREMALTDDLRLGDTVVVAPDGVVQAFALYHSAPLAFGRDADELRVLKLFADGEVSLGTLLGLLEARAARHRLPRVAIRCQTDVEWAYRHLVARGYQVRWTDLRMTLAGAAEAAVPDGEVLFTNWEI